MSADGFWRLLDRDEMVERSDEYFDIHLEEWCEFNSDISDDEFAVAGDPVWTSHVFRRWVPTA